MNILYVLLVCIKEIKCNILQNLSYKYFNHNSNIKYVNFKSICYAINLYDVSSSMIFNDFDSMFLFDIFVVCINKIVFSSKEINEYRYRHMIVDEIVKKMYQM